MKKTFLATVFVLGAFAARAEDLPGMDIAADAEMANAARQYGPAWATDRAELTTQERIDQAFEAMGPELRTIALSPVPLVLVPQMLAQPPVPYVETQAKAMDPALRAIVFSPVPLTVYPAEWSAMAQSSFEADCPRSLPEEDAALCD
jgi:hypothetical protein